MDKLKKEYANKLRIAKLIKSGNVEDLSEKDRKIGNNILRSLRIKKVSLKNWIDNKDGVRDRATWRAERKKTSSSARGASPVSPPEDIPVIKSPARPSKRRPTGAERESGERQRDKARRDRATQTVLGDVDPSRYKGWKKPKKEGDVDPSRYKGWKKPSLSAAQRESGERQRDKARRDRATQTVLGDVDPSRYKGWKKPKPKPEPKSAAVIPRLSKVQVVKQSQKPKPTPKPIPKPTPKPVAVIPRPKIKPQRPKERVSDIAGKGSWPKERVSDIAGKGSWPKERVSDIAGKGSWPAERELKPLEGGVRYADLPEWLGGGQIKIDSSDDEYKKKGGRLKKSVKKSKAKPRKAKAKTRKRAALRGHGAELRGG